MANPTQAQLETIAANSAKNHNLPDGLLQRLLGQESSWNPDAPGGGIGQFTDDTTAYLRKKWGWNFNPMDPADGIEAAARYLSDLKDQFHGDTEAAVAAYNAGPGSVATAMKESFLNKDFDGNGGDWKKELQSDQQKANAANPNGPQMHTVDIYIPNVYAGGKASTSSQDFANKARSTYNPSKPTSGVATPSTPGTLQPPNIADFQTDDDNGGKVTDTAGYYKAWNDYAQTQEAQQKLQSGPLAQYVNDTINDITQQIEAGKLDVSKANNLLTTKVNAFKDANDIYSSKAFTAGAPVGATTIPGAFSWSPGTAIPGGGTVLNPLQQALDISNQAQGLYSGMPTPQVPSLSSTMAGYGGQYGGTPGASVAPNPLQQAVQASGPQGPVGPNGPVGGQPMGPQGPQGMPPPPPAPPPAPLVGSNNPPAGSTSVTKDSTASSSNASASDVAALARILAQQAQGLGASN